MEVKDQILDQLAKLDKNIEAMEAKATEQAKLSGSVAEDLRGQLTKAQETYTDMQKRLDAIEAAAGRIEGANAKGESFAENLVKSLRGAKDQLVAIPGSKQAVQIDLKAAIDMTTAASLTGEVIAATRVPGFFHDPENMAHVRNYIPTATTSSNIIRYVEETGFEDFVNITGEGVLKPASSFELEAKIADVKKIATHFKLSTEMLDDVEGLAGYISTRGTAKYRKREDQQLLYGTGLTGQIRGLTVAAADYAGVLGVRDNQYDVLVDALAQLAARNYTASAVMINPIDWYKMLLTKNASDEYVLPQEVRLGLQAPSVNGVRIVPTTAVTADDFLVANFAQMATLFDRQGVTVRFFEQNEDDAVKNMITVVVEGRLALPVYLPNAGVFGQFTPIITAP